MKRLISIITALLLVAQLPLSALAVEFDLSVDSVSVDDTHAQYVSNDESRQEHGGSVTITQSNSETPTSNTVTVTTTSNDVTVTLDNVNIDVSDTGDIIVPIEIGDAAVSVDRAEGTTVTVELEGTNNLSSGAFRGGLEVTGDGELVIDGDGTINATGGEYGAGIGGGVVFDVENGEMIANGDNITISGGIINANGGGSAAGIGGGYTGSGSSITVEGGIVKAQGGNSAVGIGGGSYGAGSDIAIKDGYVEAYGDTGIGSGNFNDAGKNITIEGGTVIATGESGAGIGGGMLGNYSGITISGGTVTATSTGNGAGIGGGTNGAAEDIVLKEDANVTATGSGNGADIGDGNVNGSEDKQENKVDISEMNPTGTIVGSGGVIIWGEEEEAPTIQPVPAPTPAEPEVTPVEEGEEETAPVSYPAAVEEEEPIFDIFKNGETEMEGTEEVKGDVLYVEAKAGHASFTVKLSQLKALAAKGIETVVFMTENGAAAYSLDALLEALEGAEDLTVTIDGETVTLHYGDQEKTELLLDKETVEKLVEAR